MKIYAKIYAYCVLCDCFFNQIYLLENNEGYEWVPQRQRGSKRLHPDTFIEFERWIRCGEKSHWGECAKFDERDLNGNYSTSNS